MIFYIVVILVNIMLASVMYIFLRKRIDKLTDTDKMTGDIARELDRILAEINQATDRNVMIIEDKKQELDQVILKAEQRISLLKKDIKLTKSRQPSPPAEIVKRPEPAAPAPEQIPEPAAKPVREAVAGISETPQAELTYSHLNRMNTMSGLVTPLKVPEKILETEVDEKQRVIELYRSGLDAPVIAASMGLNMGEIELIISLYRQKENRQG